MKKAPLPFSVFFVFFASLILQLLSHLSSAAALPHPAMRAYIVWNAAARGADSLDQSWLETVARTLGPPPERMVCADLSYARLDSTVLLLLPHSSGESLKSDETQGLMRGLQNGLRIVTEGRSPLSDSLQVRLGESVRVEFVRDLADRQIGIRWWKRPLVPWISRYPRSHAKKLYSEITTGKPLGIVLDAGRGKALFLSTRLQASSSGREERFPTLPNAILRELGYRTLFERAGAEAYFDPGYRPDESPELLARRWKDWGIRAVHIGAWYIYGDTPYDYRALVEALHRNGILAYAWLEWPYVGKGFWDVHPEWRQKNALLRDAHLDFLYLMDLQNPKCMAQALTDLDSLLDEDWDGIDVAEFTMTGAGGEALKGPARPDYFTGFTDVGRSGFRQQEGFDPVKLFDRSSPHFWKRDSTGLKAFYRYRAEVNSTTERLLFESLQSMKWKEDRPWEFILTIVDNSQNPEFDNLLGFDTQKTLELVRDYNITLQIEDPYTEWTKSADRYRLLADHYTRLLRGRPFAIDVNVVPMIRDRRKAFATVQPTGTELLLLWDAASDRTQRVCFYCESSVYESDWQTLPHAMASRAVITGDSTTWKVSSPYGVKINVEGTGWFLDGKRWPCYDNISVLLPAGDHMLRPALPSEESAVPSIRLVGISDQLLEAWGKDGETALDYKAVGRCALTFSDIPWKIFLDGELTNLPLYAGEGTCVVIAPPGQHHIAVSAW